MTNAERTKAGCGALKWESRLATAARAHSADMASNNYFSHTDLKGGGPSDRIAAAGYKPWRMNGENIAAGQRSPQEVMTGWMNSPGHRANILNCSYKDFGAGVAMRGSEPYWTQDFGTLQ